MEINIDLKYNTDKVHTFGGEFEADNIEFNDYGFTIGGLSIELNKETTLDLVRTLKEHLELNGNKI